LIISGVREVEAHPLIEIDSISKTYGNVKAPAVDGVSLSVPQGAFIALVGMSGDLGPVLRVEPPAYAQNEPFSK
jgi:ABC-type transporter Mla maintaining outer membrane lipid asymmetry ATPase subunit MlaF